MTRDPLHRAIIARLAGELPPEAFERCAADLLRQIYPTVAPVRGGSDAGMDGVLIDEQGRQNILVTTTSPRFGLNFRKNILSHIESGGRARRAILATSHPVTGRMRLKLEREAAKLGFELRNVYDRFAFADLLYHDARWRYDLLGLTGAPPALSKFPRTSRPLVDVALVGRNADIEWLRASRGDLVIVGVPGSGKTSLAAVLVGDGNALFVVDRDLGRISDDLRSANPRAVIVDDAHLDPRQLLELRQLRDEIGGRFSIIATTWPGDVALVENALVSNTADTRVLQPLTSKEIVTVIKQAGIAGPTSLLYEIVDQARGRPGLAVTLTRLCLAGDVKAVVMGDAIASRSGFAEALGDVPLELVAAFSVGGEAGLSMKAVARVLQMPVQEVRRELGRLAFAGVIEPLVDDRIAVVPAALRIAFVHQVFFDRVRLPLIADFVDAAPSLAEVSLVMIGAAARGADIRRDWLLDLLERAGSERAWATFAGLGRAEAEVALERHPEFLTELASPGLILAPEIFIPCLLQAAVPEVREPHSYPDHPFRKLEYWAFAIEIDRDDRLQRRRVLFNIAARWLRHGRNVGIGLRALTIALSPKIEQSTSDPGDERTLTISSGLLPLEDIRSHALLWNDAVVLINGLSDPDWALVLKATNDWAYPHLAMMGRTVPPRAAKFMTSHATRMLRDIAEMAVDHPGVIHAIASIRDQLKLRLRLDVDPEFETLFPKVDYEDLEQGGAKSRARARRLAIAWEKLPPHQVSERIMALEDEATKAGLPMWPRETPYVCGSIAEATSAPALWIRALVDRNAPGDLVAPFLERLLEQQPPGWVDLFERCVEQASTRSWAVAITLEIPSKFDTSIIDLALSKVTPTVAETVVRRGHTTNELVKRLLSHPDAKVAVAASVGLWHRSKHQLPEANLSEWRRALLRTELDDLLSYRHWVGEILAFDPVLALAWLRARSSERSFPAVYSAGGLCEKAVSALSPEQRSVLLSEISDASVGGAAVRARLLAAKTA